MRFTERIRDRLKKLTRRRWAYKVVRAIDGRYYSAMWHLLPKQWGVEYRPDRWRAAPDHSLLMVFGSEWEAIDWARGWRSTRKDFEVWRVEVEDVKELSEKCRSLSLRSFVSFWSNPNNETGVERPPYGTLGATKVKLVRQIG